MNFIRVKGIDKPIYYINPEVISFLQEWLGETTNVFTTSGVSPVRTNSSVSQILEAIELATGTKPRIVDVASN